MSLPSLGLPAQCLANEIYSCGYEIRSFGDEMAFLGNEIVPPGNKIPAVWKRLGQRTAGFVARFREWGRNATEMNPGPGSPLPCGGQFARANNFFTTDIALIGRIG